MAVDVSKLTRYLTAVEDNHRWAGFDARPSDIFICTPPKCGTTWTQTIVASLLWPAGDQPDDIMALSPWVDAKFMPVDALHARLRAQPHRRFIKTHTPADGIPWYDEAKYIVVARDGRDAFMSMCNHMERMSADAKAGLNAQIKDDPDIMLLPDWTGDIHGFFKTWLAHMSIMEFVATYWPKRAQKNLLFVHYNDLKADLSGEMKRIANFLNIDVPATLWDATVERCTFEAMRNDEKRMGAFAVFEGGVKGFIFKGTNGRWRDVLTADELAAFDAKVAAVMTPDAAEWMVNGRVKLAGAANP